MNMNEKVKHSLIKAILHDFEKIRFVQMCS